MAISKIVTNSIAPAQTLSAPIISGTMDLQGGQIKFPMAQVPSSDANTLDDYEEGTWTPILSGTTNPTAVYTTQRGNYVKIGRKVYASFYVAYSSFTGGSGRAGIGGLPFTAVAIGSADDNCGSIQEHSGILVYPAGRTWVTIYVTNGGTNAHLCANGSGVSGSDMTVGTNLVSASGYILGAVTYTTN